MTTSESATAIKLTEYSHGAGCGCKISPKILDSILASPLQLLSAWSMVVVRPAPTPSALAGIMGVLGIATLGFFVDSVFEEIRYDKALFLIAIAALLNIMLDSLARRLRRWAGVEQAAGLS